MIIDEIFLIQWKPVYSNHFFAAENGKNKPMKISTKCVFFKDQSNIINVFVPNFNTPNLSFFYLNNCE